MVHPLGADCIPLSATLWARVAYIINNFPKLTDYTVVQS